MDEAPRERPGRRFVEAVRQFNRHPKLVRATRRTRERALGGTDPADLAAEHLVSARGDTPGLLGELGLTAVQAWQRLAESQDRGRGRVDVAILFTDLVGFSSLALGAGDEPALRVMRAGTAAIEPPVTERQGEVVKRLGDGLMAVFWDARTAVE